jgi:hypothetical protein
VVGIGRRGKAIAGGTWSWWTDPLGVRKRCTAILRGRRLCSSRIWGPRIGCAVRGGTLWGGDYDDMIGISWGHHTMGAGDRATFLMKGGAGGRGAHPPSKRRMNFSQRLYLLLKPPDTNFSRLTHN